MSKLVEVIIFGKGYGESILLHLDKKWVVVDSFIDIDSKKPISLKYLEEHGEDPSNIVGIICTHWDNDHVAGVSDIVKMIDSKIPICLPIVKNDKRFSDYIAFYSDKNIELGSEFLKILKLKSSGKCSFVNVIADRMLLGKEVGDSEISIKALSPSDEQLNAFLDAIVIPSKGQKKRLPVEENRISIVTYIKICADAILLGGDMENSKVGGWNDICDAFYEENKCHVYKIPHHGSSNAYNEKVWESIVEKPISVITRYSNSHLPKDEMIKNISAVSSITYVVGPRMRKDKDVVKEIRKFDKNSSVKSVLVLDNKYGYVKLGKEFNETSWNVIETFGAVEEYLN